jgi:phenylacetate-CoA ligase
MMIVNLLKIMARERQSADRIEKLHSKLLSGVVKKAYRFVPYYRDLYSGLDESVINSIRSTKDLVKLPIVKRDDLKQKPLKYRMDERFDMSEVRVYSTSGTTGMPLEICNSKRDLSYLRMIFMNDLIQAGARPWDRVVYLRVAKFVKNPLERFGILPFFQIPTNRPIEWQTDEFLRVRPTILTGFFNTTYLIVQELKKRGMKYNKLKGLLLGGERIKASTKKEIEEYFQCAVTEIYSSTDTFTIARECHKGNKHIHSGDIIVEVLKDDGTTSFDEGEGEILITRLKSEAMPFIRYQLGDRIVLKPNDCTCGIYHTPIIKEVYGRANDFILDQEDKLISSAILLCIADTFEKIQQIQFFQKSKSEIEIRYVTGNNKDQIDDQVLERFSSALPQFAFKVKKAEELERLPNGKIKIVNSDFGICP